MFEEDRNEVHLIGTALFDAKSGITKNGHKWASLTIATKKIIKDKPVYTDHRIAAWANNAEAVEFCKKGDRVTVSGEIQKNTYENKEGKKVNQYQILASEISIESVNRDQGNYEESEVGY